jgi:hypothetical protein
MDNGGENLKLEKRSKSNNWQLRITLKKQHVTLPSKTAWQQSG